MAGIDSSWTPWLTLSTWQGHTTSPGLPDAVSVHTVDKILKDLKYSMEESINASILSYSKTRDLFADRLEMVDKTLVHKVLFFRSYLWVSNDKHRQALTHVLLSGRALASERMTWGERYHPESIPTRYTHYLCVRQRLYCPCDAISSPISLTRCRN
ncbi:hypothetical protein B0H10DRAFT_2077763 [Mycena sp. CBHHK59/15]|nr:hypothetical protein B0H10DRAFT_2077763 [Mycena sp. CBHHK59/15]